MLVCRHRVDIVTLFVSNAVPCPTSTSDIRRHIVRLYNKIEGVVQVHRNDVSREKQIINLCGGVAGKAPNSGGNTAGVSTVVLSCQNCSPPLFFWSTRSRKAGTVCGPQPNLGLQSPTTPLLSWLKTRTWSETRCFFLSNANSARVSFN